MSPIPKETVTRSLLAKLYEVLTARPDGDADALPENEFVAWCQPGLPFEPEDLDFAVRGIGGGAGEGDDVRRRTARADDWSRLVNFVPNATGVFDDAQQKKMFDTTAFSTDGASIASIYGNVLRFSEVAQGELSDEVKQKLERFRGLLVEVREEEDLLTGEKVEVVDDAPAVKRYNELMAEYLDAVTQFNSKRIAALNTDDGLAVQDWALNADNYRMRVRAALGKWTSVGKKNDIEAMRAFIDQVTMRDLTLLKADLLDKIDRAKLNSPVSGDSFYWTSFIPANLATSDGWQEQSFKHSEIKIHESSKTTAFGGNVSLPIGSWFGLKGSGSSETERIEKEVNTDDFSLTFELAQAIISRGWLAMEFLRSNAWRFSPDMPNLTNLTSTLSDGSVPPQGSLIGIPTAAIFARNVTLDFKELHEQSSDFRRDIEGGLDLKIGPFNLGGGKFKRGEKEHQMQRELTEEGLKVKGMQVIGFRCVLLPKLPNPAPNVENWA